MNEPIPDLNDSRSDPDCTCKECRIIRDLEYELESAWEIIMRQRERIKTLTNETNAVSFQEQQP